MWFLTEGVHLLLLKLNHENIYRFLLFDLLELIVFALFYVHLFTCNLFFKSFYVLGQDPKLPFRYKKYKKIKLENILNATVDLSLKLHQE